MMNLLAIQHHGLRNGLTNLQLLLPPYNKTASNSNSYLDTDESKAVHRNTV